MRYIIVYYKLYREGRQISLATGYLQFLFFIVQVFFGYYLLFISQAGILSLRLLPKALFEKFSTRIHILNFLRKSLTYNKKIKLYVGPNCL